MAGILIPSIAVAVFSASSLSEYGNLQSNPSVQYYLYQYFTQIPVEQQQGLARILVYSSLEDKYINCSVSIYNYTTQTYITSILTNVTFQLNGSSVGLVDVSNLLPFNTSVTTPAYYPYACSIKGSGSNVGDPFVNTFYILNRTYNDSIIAQIVSVDYNYSRNTVISIGNGSHTIEIQVINNGWMANSSIYGFGSIMPNDTYKFDTNQLSYGFTMYGPWLLFNGSINNAFYTEYSHLYYPPIFNITVNSKEYNITPILHPIDLYSFHIYLTANFTNCFNIRVYEGFAGNIYNNYKEFA